METKVFGSVKGCVYPGQRDRREVSEVVQAVIIWGRVKDVMCPQF